MLAFGFQEDRIIRDLTGTRANLHAVLLRACLTGHAEILASYTCKLRNVDQTIEKQLLRVIDPHLAEAVRVRDEQLRALRQQLVDLGHDLAGEIGLWVPAMADPQRGDSQLNLMVYENGVTKTIDAAKLVEMAEDENPAVRAHLAALGARHAELVLRRDSGKAYKVAIRGERRADGREVCGLNEFAVVIGKEIRVVLPAGKDRPRATRRDKCRGAPALLAFQGARGQQWTVYAKEERC